MLQMQHNKKTGVFYLLNEYGDMTKEEFHQMKTRGKGNVRPPTSRDGTRMPKARTSLQDGGNLSGVDVVEALAKTAQEYQNLLTRKSATQRRRKPSSKQRRASQERPKPQSPSGGAFSSPSETEEDYQPFVDGCNTEPLVSSPAEPSVSKINDPKIEEPSKGYSVIAELVEDPPRQEKHDGVAFYETHDNSHQPRVQPMGADPHGRTRKDRSSQPGSLEPKFFHTVKGKPSNKSFFTGIGTQVVGVSSNKRLVQWEPGMDQWA